MRSTRARSGLIQRGHVMICLSVCRLTRGSRSFGKEGVCSVWQDSLPKPSIIALYIYMRGLRIFVTPAGPAQPPGPVTSRRSYFSYRKPDIHGSKYIKHSEVILSLFGLFNDTPLPKLLSISMIDFIALRIFIRRGISFPYCIFDPRIIKELRRANPPFQSVPFFDVQNVPTSFDTRPAMLCTPV